MLSSLEVPHLNRGQAVGAWDVSAKSRAPRSQMAMSGQKLLGSPSAKFPALRKCHHLNSPRGSGERRMGAAAVLLEGASVVREGSGKGPVTSPT